MEQLLVKNTVLKGILLMIAAVSLFSVKDAAAKYLSREFSVVEIIFFQYAVMFIIILPIQLVKMGPRGLKTRHTFSLLLRGAIGVSAVFFLFLSLSFIPLADATAIIFISPIVVTIFSPLFLGEQVGVRRWIAVVIGFFGVLLIVQPKFLVSFFGSLGQTVSNDFLYGVSSAIASGVLFGFYGIITRKLTTQEPIYVMMLYTATVGLVATSIILPFIWVPPDFAYFLMLCLVGVISTCGHALMVLSYSAAPATIVTPFVYTSIIVATAIGYFAFGDFPSLMAWIGILTIILSGLYIGFREAKIQ